MLDYDMPSDLLDEYSRAIHGHDQWAISTDGHGNVVITFFAEEEE